MGEELKSVALCLLDDLNISEERAEDKIEDFTRRVFCLRSKVAHGAKPIEQIENLIAHRANDGIPEDWGERTPIPNGDYKNLLIDDGPFFSGFLVNLRSVPFMGSWISQSLP